jgi:hypothetical protein
MSPLRTSPQPSGGQSKSESECAWLAAGPGAALATSPGPVHRTRGWPGASRRGTAGRATMAPRRLRDGRVHALLALLLLLLLLWPPVTRGRERLASGQGHRRGRERWAGRHRAPDLPGRPGSRPGGSGARRQRPGRGRGARQEPRAGRSAASSPRVPCTQGSRATRDLGSL